ncbi:hypothetical protein [Leptolyngbya ohadii]|uniref:hypothetical protein n=1 Tax=Leptolyngbya ohadii TaxID=1962290 RepID=UPI0015C5B50B|nr:hypothetical protein [Leptolyngbya ohadii]
MKNRRDAKSNGKNSRDRRDLYYEMEFLGQTPPPAPQRRRRLAKMLTSPLLGIALIGATISFAIVVAVQDTQWDGRQESQTSPSEPFRWAVNRAMSAAELTQQARSVKEWQTVANWWQEAIVLMQKVPTSYPRYGVAQSRIPQYEENLRYAQRKVQEASQVQAGNSLWSVGSRRAQVVDLQGKPSSTDRYDSMCREVLRYGRSVVELRNGVVTSYEDADRNLRVTSEAAASVAGSSAYWELGSTKEAVFAVQGTPSRVVKYDYSRKELLYYGDSLVELNHNQVIGYSNLGKNLRVQIRPIGQTEGQPFWTMDSTREDLFRIQGTPTQVELDDATCTETLTYGNSSVELTNGFITGYNNADNNLKVRVQN